jgi:hypothetical protein
MTMTHHVSHLRPDGSTFPPVTPDPPPPPGYEPPRVPEPIAPEPAGEPDAAPTPDTGGGQEPPD